MKRNITFIAMLLIAACAFAQDTLRVYSVKGDELLGTVDKTVYTNGLVRISVLPASTGKLYPEFRLYAPEGDFYELRGKEWVAIGLYDCEGNLKRKIEYSASATNDGSMLHLYMDSQQAFHIDHVLNGESCGCRQMEKTSIYEIWNMLVNEDGYVRFAANTWNGLMDTRIWTFKHQGKTMPELHP